MPDPFPEAEFQQRCAHAQAAMEREGLSALLLTGEADVRYFSGFLTRFWESPTRPWFVVIPAIGKPVAVIPGIGAELMGATWVEDIRTWAAPDYDDDGVSLLGETLREVTGPGARIGVPMGRETQLRMPLGDWMRLCTDVDGREMVDATAIIQAQQQVKSPAEIALIRDICAIGGRAFNRVPQIAVPGVTLAQLFRRFQMALLEEGADWVPYLAGGAGPGGYGDVISPARDVPLARGDLVMLDTGAMRQGYFCDFDRNWALGEAAPEVMEANRILFDATEAGFAAARVGATMADLYHAMNRVIAGAGDAGAGGRLGHGMGMRLTDPPSIVPADHTVLAPGMVLTLEPALQMGAGRMMVHEEDIVIGAERPEWLSPRGPRELPVLEWSA